MFYSIKSFLHYKVNLYKKNKIISRFSEQFKNYPKLNNPFFMIVMPGGLHVASLSVHLVPSEQDIVIIMNGLDDWEKEWVRNNLKVSWIAETESQLEHSEVLDVLFDKVEQNFGILDYDCFILNSSYFDRFIEIDDQTSMNACFLRRNEKLNIDVPETFILFFNTKLIKILISDYKIGCAQVRWENISPLVKDQLRSIKLDEKNLPEQHKPYYDTLRVLMLLSVARNIPYRFIDKLPATPVPFGEIFHIGGISNPLDINGVWSFRGSYFWKKLLESSSDQKLIRYYSKKFNLCSSQELLVKYPEWKCDIGEDFLKFCDELIEMQGFNYQKGSPGNNKN